MLSAKRSPQGPPNVTPGPVPPPQYGRNLFNNRGPPFGRGPPFVHQPPDYRSPPGQNQYWVPPGHRKRPGNGIWQDGYNFQKVLPQPEIPYSVIPNGSQATEKKYLQHDADKITYKTLEQTTKNLINTVTENSAATTAEKDNVKITYYAGRAVAVVNGNSIEGTKIIPVTLVFQAQPVTPASLS